MRQFTFSGIEKFVLHQKSFIFVDLQKIIFVRHFWCCSGNNATQGLLRRRNPTCSCFFSFLLSIFPLKFQTINKTEKKRTKSSKSSYDFVAAVTSQGMQVKFSAMAFVGFVQIVATKVRQKAVCIRINDKQRNSQ